jgi:hypothetical protein
MSGPLPATTQHGLTAWQMPPRCAVCGYDILGTRVALPFSKLTGPEFRHPGCEFPKDSP